jgi:hypothetical protein
VAETISANRPIYELDAQRRYFHRGPKQHQP